MRFEGIHTCHLIQTVLSMYRFFAILSRFKQTDKIIPPPNSSLILKVDSQFPSLRDDILNAISINECY